MAKFEIRYKIKKLDKGFVVEKKDNTDPSLEVANTANNIFCEDMPFPGYN